MVPKIHLFFTLYELYLVYLNFMNRAKKELILIIASIMATLGVGVWIYSFTVEAIVASIGIWLILSGIVLLIGGVITADKEYNFGRLPALSPVLIAVGLLFFMLTL